MSSAAYSTGAVVGAQLAQQRASNLAAPLSSVSVSVRIESIGSCVAHRLELLARRAADALGRRVGRAQLRVLLLQRLQLAEQAVVLRVADLRASST